MMRSLVLLLALAVSPAQAAVVAYQFTGAVTNVSGSFSTSSGASLSGVFVYDDTWLPGAIGPDLGFYRAQNDAYGISITFDGATYDSASTNSQINHVIDVVNDRGFEGSEFDELNIRANPGDHLQPTYMLDLVTLAGNTSALSGIGLPSTLEFEAFDGVNTGFLELGSGGGRLDFEITSITAVPVPTAVWLFVSALLGLKCMRRRF